MADRMVSKLENMLAMVTSEPSSTPISLFYSYSHKDDIKAPAVGLGGSQRDPFQPGRVPRH